MKRPIRGISLSPFVAGGPTCTRDPLAVRSAIPFSSSALILLVVLDSWKRVQSPRKPSLSVAWWKKWTKRQFTRVFLRLVRSHQVSERAPTAHAEHRRHSRSPAAFCSSQPAPTKWYIDAPCSVENRLISPAEQQKHRGFAFVTFGSAQDAQDAIDNMDLNELKGKVIKVNLARPMKGPIQPLGNRAGM